MSNWADISLDSKRAAFELSGDGRYRSALSRAYYAAFAAITQRLVDSGMNFPRDWEGPTHEQMTAGWIVANNLKSSVEVADRGRLIAILPSLYKLRLIADYRPSMLVSQDDVKLALGDMVRVFEILEVV
jgi:uncharacterized protein (UPF0332 family)